MILGVWNDDPKRSQNVMCKNSKTDDAKVLKSLPFGLEHFWGESSFFTFFHHFSCRKKGHFSWFQGVKMWPHGSQVSTSVLDPFGTWNPMGFHGTISTSVFLGKAPRRMILEMYMSMFDMSGGIHHHDYGPSKSGHFTCQKGSKNSDF